jgi:hypothetical protein
MDGFRRKTPTTVATDGRLSSVYPDNGQAEIRRLRLMAVRLRRPKKHKQRKPLPWLVLASAVFAFVVICVGAYWVYTLVDDPTGDTRCVMPDPLLSA